MHKVHYRPVDNILMPMFCGLKATKRRKTTTEISLVTCKACLKKVEDLSEKKNEGDNSGKQNDN